MENHIDLSIKASYSTLNSFTNKTKKVWIAFHGYGMLSGFFIKKFEILDSEENFIIAPQGLSKFYLEGFTGRVGASWMTREDRLTEIENQRVFVQKILEKENILSFGGEIVFFGFSQGVATACRYAEVSDLNFNKLILWAGRFPEDVQRKVWPENLEITYVTGVKDPFLKEGMIEEQHRVVRSITQIDPKRIEFDGKHEIIPELIPKL